VVKTPCAGNRTGYPESMSTGEIIDQLRALPPAERREAVEKIWDEFADRDLELSPQQAVELDRRLAEHQARPDEVVSWNEVKAATEAKYRGKG
jgi:putative addiction module component (TIGR02574 family)